MFILALIASIVIGYVLNGRLKNLESLEVNKIYLVFAGFFMEFGVVMLIKNGALKAGLFTCIIDLAMYVMMFAFIFYNRKNHFIVIMGFGFLLNAIAIFSNGGAMPVSIEAIRGAGINENITREGLYKLVDSSTKVWFLGDVIPFTIIRRFAISIGDMIGAIGLMLLIITGMKPKLLMKS